MAIDLGGANHRVHGFMPDSSWNFVVGSNVWLLARIGVEGLLERKQCQMPDME
jgi:hypothetical protein